MLRGRREVTPASRIAAISSGLTPVFSEPSVPVALDEPRCNSYPRPSPKAARASKTGLFLRIFQKILSFPNYMLRSLIQLGLSPFCPSYPVRTQTFSFTNRNRSAPRMLQTPPNGLCNTFRLQPQIPRPNGMNRATLKRESAVARAIRAHAKLPQGGENSAPPSRTDTLPEKKLACASGICIIWR